MVRGFGTDVYLLLHREWMSNKGLLPSTGDSAQVTGSLDGSGLGAHVHMWTHAFIRLSSFAVRLELLQRC